LAVCLALASLSCDSIKQLNQRVLYQKASTAHDEQNFDKAISLYREFLASEPNNALVNYDLGVAYTQKKDFSRAEAQIGKLKKLGRADLADQLLQVMEKARHREQMMRPSS